MRRKTNVQIEKIEYSKLFQKQYKQAPTEIKHAFRDSLDLFLSNPTDPVLRNHALRDEYKGYRSINVTDDWRAFFKEFRKGAIIHFDILGTHPQLFKTQMD